MYSLSHHRLAMLAPVFGWLLFCGSHHHSLFAQDDEESVGGNSDLVSERDIEVGQAVLKIIASVDIPAQRSGLLEEVQVKEGDLIERGSLIANIDDRQAALRFEEAKIELKIAEREAADDINIRFAKKSLEVAQAELERSRELNSGKYTLVTKTELERLELIVEKNVLEIERAELELASSNDKVELHRNQAAIREDELVRHEIRSPIDGMVVSVERKQGEWIKESEAVARIVRIDQLRVEGFVDATEAARGLVGRAVTLVLEDGGSEQVASGKIVFVNPEAITVSNRSKIRVWAEVENHDRRLFPGQKGRLIIHAP